VSQFRCIWNIRCYDSFNFAIAGYVGILFESHTLAGDDEICVPALTAQLLFKLQPLTCVVLENGKQVRFPQHALESLAAK
jgi:hypothetical protein